MFNVEDNSGDPNLGGNDMDSALMQLVLQKLKNEHGIDIREFKNQAKKLAQIKEFCENAKIIGNSHTKDYDEEDDKKESNSHKKRHYFNYEEFKQKNDGYIYEVFLTGVFSGDVDCPDSIYFTFKEVTEAYMKCLEGAIKPLKYIITKPGQTPKELSHVLLVGGSSRLLLFRQLLYREGFERTQFEAIDPMACVAKGAYVLAKMFNDPDFKMKMTERIAISYGLKSGNNSVVILLRKGQKLPAASQGISFTNMSDEPARIEIMAYQCVDDDKGKGEVSIEKCNLIKAWQFDNPMKYRQPKGEQLLELQFKLEVGGTLKVTCKDVARNRLLLTGETSVIYENQ